MKEYMLINPSDPYTFEAEDFETAALVVFSLSTAYAAEPKDGGEEVPIFLFGGAEKWFTETFSKTFEEAISDPGTVEKLAQALASMMLGDFKDRARYNAALEAITDPEKKAAFIEKWQDGHSSLNNIGGSAHAMARALRTRDDTDSREI